VEAKMTNPPLLLPPQESLTTKALLPHLPTLVTKYYTHTFDLVYAPYNGAVAAEIFEIDPRTHKWEETQREEEENESGIRIAVCRWKRQDTVGAPTDDDTPDGQAGYDENEDVDKWDDEDSRWDGLEQGAREQDVEIIRDIRQTTQGEGLERQKHGVERILEALECNIWNGCTMNHRSRGSDSEDEERVEVYNGEAEAEQRTASQEKHDGSESEFSDDSQSHLPQHEFQQLCEDNDFADYAAYDGTLSGDHDDTAEPEEDDEADLDTFLQSLLHLKSKSSGSDRERVDAAERAIEMIMGMKV